MTNTFSFLASTVIPSLSDIQDFNPAGESAFINPGTTASTELINHWLFTNAIPQWISYLITFSAGMAILMIVAAGGMLMLNPEEEEMKTKGYKTIIWALGGLIITVLAYTIVEIVNSIPSFGSAVSNDLVVETGQGIGNLAQGNLRSDIIPGIIQLIFKVMGSLALALLLYAGALLVIRDGDEEKVTKARRLMVWSVLGVVIALFAYLVVEAVVNLNFQNN